MESNVWLTALGVFCVMEKEKYNCSFEVCGLGKCKIHAHIATHYYYSAQPAKLPCLWFSLGKEALVCAARSTAHRAKTSSWCPPAQCQEALTKTQRQSVWQH